MKKMMIIVASGVGFIGGNFIYYMLEKYNNYRIVCLDALTYDSDKETLRCIIDNPNFRFIKGNIYNRKFVYKLFKETSYEK